MGTQIKPGLYKHFKGNFYRVISLAKNSETEEELVVYQALYGERGTWVRPMTMWCEEVEHEGSVVPRFSPVPDLT